MKKKRTIGSAQLDDHASATAQASRALKRSRAQQSVKVGKHRGSTLRESLLKRLHGSQFRKLNEELYTLDGEANFNRFSKEPALAEAYHRGFREQIARWPSNPLDAIIRSLACRDSSLLVADFGCGDARLASELGHKHTVHSFDLVATKEGVVACNMANTSLASSSIDVAVFCLALMGPSFLDFLLEAYRVLRPKGELKIAEVRSRFDEQAGGVEKFVETLRFIGFDLKRAPDTSNTHFLAFEFAKAKARRPNMRNVRKLGFAFKVCRYKKR